MPHAPIDPAHDPRRQAILRHGRRAFITLGYSATRIEPIAREAAVSTATLYTYFESKAELFGAVIEDATDDFGRKMSLVRMADGSPRQQIEQFALAYAHFMGDPFIRAVFRLVMAERPRFGDVARHFFDRGRREFGYPLIATLTLMAERGELRLEKPSWAAGQLLGMIEHPIFFMPLVTGDEVHALRSPEQIAGDAVETFMARYAV